MKTKSSPQPVLANRSSHQGGFFRLRVIALLTLVTGVFLIAFGGFVTAKPSNGDGHTSGARPDTPQAPSSSQLTGRTLARVTSEGVITENLLAGDEQSVAVATALRRRADVSSNPGAPRHSEAATTLIRERRALQTLGNTLWQVDDENAIAGRRRHRRQRCVGRMDSSGRPARRLPDWRQRHTRF
jgi:hypothetical protein